MICESAKCQITHSHINLYKHNIILVQDNNIHVILSYHNRFTRKRKLSWRRLSILELNYILSAGKMWSLPVQTGYVRVTALWTRWGTHSPLYVGRHISRNKILGRHWKTPWNRIKSDYVNEKLFIIRLVIIDFANLFE